MSDTFASALWVLDTLFNMARVGVDGVNIHTFRKAVYQPFSFTHSRGGWRAHVEPMYYGMLMFARAAPTGSRLLPTYPASSQALMLTAPALRSRTGVTIAGQSFADATTTAELTRSYRITTLQPIQHPT